MVNIFKIPKNRYRDFHSQSIFALSYRVSFLNGLLFLILMGVHMSKFGIAFFLCAAVFVVSALSIWYMHKFGTHSLVAKFTIVVGSLLIQANIYLVLSPERFTDIIWLIIIIHYSFYAVGRNWGIATLTINFLGIMLYQNILGPIELKNLFEYKIETQIDYYLTIVFGGVMIGYLLILFSNTQKISNIKYKEANKKLREKNKIVEEQNQEKTVMLKEIHHRVKNNLQVITSLLRLQSKDIEDPKVIIQFNEATNRVLAMALIHEKIYQTDNLSDIDLSTYFETLTKELIRSYTLEIPIETSITANISAVTPDHMVPFALLLNELTSNSLKHGFQSKETGKIEIHFTEVDDNIELVYKDNGSWNLPAKQFSFGLELIDTLTEQLDGKYTRHTENGTEYHFSFPKKID